MLTRPNKYGAKRAVDHNGRMYDSGLERDRAEQLRLLEIAGEISGLEAQPRVELEPSIWFKPDFKYVENGQVFFEDTKGVVTDRFRLICKLWALHGPAPLRITRRRSRKEGFLVEKTIVPPSR